MRREAIRYDKPEDWQRVRVWWSAKHKWNQTVHLAASISNGKITRCGLRIYPSSKTWRLYEWQRHGNSPITPTCGQCLRGRNADIAMRGRDE